MYLDDLLVLYCVMSVNKTLTVSRNSDQAPASGVRRALIVLGIRLLLSISQKRYLFQRATLFALIIVSNSLCRVVVLYRNCCYFTYVVTFLVLICYQ